MASSAINPPSNQTSVSKWRWMCGMLYVVVVALIWILASFVVQSVVDAGVSPFLITYICNSLFVVYIPIVEAGRCLESGIQRYGWIRNGYRRVLNQQEKITESPHGSLPERETLLETVEARIEGSASQGSTRKEISDAHEVQDLNGLGTPEFEEGSLVNGDVKQEVAEVASNDKPWTRMRTALVAMAICPLWFLAQLTFNFSLKFTTVTSNTVLSTTSSLFTFLMSLLFIGERFTWLKLASVCFCMMGTILVSLGDSWNERYTAPNPLLGDGLCILSAVIYATYTTLIRVKIPDEEDKKGKVSTALVFGYIGLFNAVFLAPVALLLHVTGVEPFHRLTLTQFGLIVAKGLLDNVLSDYLWARAVLLTTPTAATAGLTIQVPIAAVVDSIRGVVPSFVDILGGVAVLIGFFGINQAGPQSPLTEELVEKVVDDEVTVRSSV